jgi:hypothetical protein
MMGVCRFRPIQHQRISSGRDVSGPDVGTFYNCVSDCDLKRSSACKRRAERYVFTGNGAALTLKHRTPRLLREDMF